MQVVNAPPVSKSGFRDKFLSNDVLTGYLFILPSLIGFAIFYAYPAIRSVFISFLDWNLLTEAEFIGIENYQELLTDARFWRALGITLQYVLWNIPLQTVLAILIAVLLDKVHNSAFLRGIMVLPWLMPNVVVGLLWLWILDPSLGIMNVALEAIGLPAQPFMGSPSQAIAVIALINIWRHAGYTAILVFAGLKTIPNSLYEAAAIDGATGPRQFWSITLPLLRPVLVFVLVTSVIGSFQIFDTISVTTAGGPAGATRVIIYYIYEQVFTRRLNMGMATAASVALFLILITVTIVQMRYFRADESDLANYQ